MIRRTIGRLTPALLAAMLVGCGSGANPAGSASTDDPRDTQQVADATSIPVVASDDVAPDDDAAELSTTADTASAHVDNSVGVDPDAQPTGVRPEGFTTTTVRITEPDGTVCEVCMWLADDTAEHGRGLMGVTDLGDAAGMVFAFDRPRTGNFFMFQTVTPLSIAWFDDDGVFVSATDMDPCVADDSALCERFAAAGPYRTAVEVVQGDLAAIGIEAGSTLVIVAGTEAETCLVNS